MRESFRKVMKLIYFPANTIIEAENLVKLSGSFLLLPQYINSSRVNGR